MLLSPYRLTEETQPSARACPPASPSLSLRKAAGLLFEGQGSLHRFPLDLKIGVIHIALPLHGEVLKD